MNNKTPEEIEIEVLALRELAAKHDGFATADEAEAAIDELIRTEPDSDAAIDASAPRTDEGDAIAAVRLQARDWKAGEQPEAVSASLIQRLKNQAS
jgi:hypothetical protein